LFKHLSQWYEHHHPCHLCSPYLQWLGISPAFCRQLVSNLYVGLLITVVLLLSPLRNIPLLVTIEDTAIDWVINLQLHTELKRLPTPHFVFLNLEEQTYQQWGEPLITPRDKLRQLIAFAVAGQPKAIVVDIDLTYPTHCITERTHCLNDSTKLDPADIELRDFLANYATSSSCNGKPCPYLILVKTTQPVLDAQGKPTSQRQLRPSFLDHIVDQNPRIYWASSLFELEDNRLRRWRLCEPGKTGKLDSLPSVQLLITELLKSEATPVAERVKEKCEDAETGEEELSQRILYSLRPTGEHVPYPLVVVPEDQVQRPLLTIQPAFQLVAHPEADKSALRQSIVVIGSSYSDSNDLYTTPVGTMPGALVVINAIHSLQQSGELHRPHWFIAICIEVFSIIVMSLAFTRFNSFYGMLVSGVFVIVVMIPLSFWLFQYGWWLDFAIPLLAVQLHRMAAVFHHSHEEV